MNDESFDVNSERYFNEKLNFWLNKLTSSDIRSILTKCLNIPVIPRGIDPTICPWDSVDSSYGKSARFDQKIDFGKQFSIIIELKVGTEASVGQLEKYLKYIIEAGYKGGCVILLSRNELAAKKLGYDKLQRDHSNLVFITWKEFETRLRDILKAGTLQGSKRLTEDFLYLLSFLTDIRKRSERLIVQPAPPIFDVLEHVATLDPAPEPKRKGPFLVWGNREEFWNDLITHIYKHSGLTSFSSFRFDFYEYLVRWAFHVKHVYLDIYEDKNYEYMYIYFITNIYPHKDKLSSALLSELYYRYLLIREDEVLSIRSSKIFFSRVGKLWYIYVVDKTYEGDKIPYLNCNKLQFP